MYHASLHIKCTPDEVSTSCGAGVEEKDERHLVKKREGCSNIVTHHANLVNL